MPSVGLIVRLIPKAIRHTYINGGPFLSAFVVDIPFLPLILGCESQKEFVNGLASHAVRFVIGDANTNGNQFFGLRLLNKQGFSAT